MTQHSRYFEGEDRLEFVEMLQRPIRMGSPKNLGESDYENVIKYINQGNFEESKKRLELLHPMYSGMNSTFLEWIIATPNILANTQNKTLVDKIKNETHIIWQTGVLTDKEFKDTKELKTIAKLLEPEKINDKSILEYRTNPSQNQSTQMLEKVNVLYQSTINSINKQDTENSINNFHSYFNSMRINHDLCGEYISSYGGQILKHLNQNLTTQIMQQGLESCNVVEGLWQLAEHGTPNLLALVLAEHLRGHFSGKNRKGAVKIVEDKEKYNLIFKVCGTGGAIRARNLVGTSFLPNKTADTWNLEDKVCTYCAHCSNNEQTSSNRFGHISFVTEFEIDSSNCGWTVYKDSKNIPQQYYNRINVKNK
jgi:hypothetical protein